MNADNQLYVASEQLLRQAHHLFEMYPHQEEVLLIAVAGVWWSYRVLSRNQSKIATAEEVEEAEYEETDTKPDIHDSEAREIAADAHDEMVDVLVGPDLARDEQDLSDLPLYRGLKNVTFQEQISVEAPLHLLMTQANFELCIGIQSDPLLFGTSPSNQALYPIHQHLESIVNNSYNGIKG